MALLTGGGSMSACLQAPTESSSQLVVSLEDHFSDLPPPEAVRLAALALLAHATWQQAQALAGDDSSAESHHRLGPGHAEARGAQRTAGASSRAARGMSAEGVLRALCQVSLPASHSGCRGGVCMHDDCRGCCSYLGQLE